MSVSHRGVDPLWVLWEALGGPQPVGAPMNKTGDCARCGAFSVSASRVKVVVSDKFTGWDHYTNSSDPLWCVPCAWAHTDPQARTRAWRIGGGAVIEATPHVLSDELEHGLDSQVAVVVPLSRHKHILPTATWGNVTTDDRTLPWTGEEANRFHTVRWLRRIGFNETALTHHAPRFEQLATLDSATMQLVLQQWGLLAPWRSDTAYLKVACLAARTKPDGAAA